MKERSDVLMVTSIFSCCLKRALTVNELTLKIYGNEYAKNIVRVYQCCEIMISHGLLVPKLVNGMLRFQVDPNVLEGGKKP